MGFSFYKHGFLWSGNLPVGGILFCPLGLFKGAEPMFEVESPIGVSPLLVYDWVLGSEDETSYLD